MSSIADEFGFFWDTLWNLKENEELKKLRKDPNILFPGDRVFVPEKRMKELDRPTGQVHHFRIKNAPAKLRIRVLDDGSPREGIPFVLEVDGKEVKRGTIPSTGWVEAGIAPGAREGRLILGEGQDREEHAFDLGYLDPIDTVEGVQARLNNLGFDCGPVDGTLNEFTVDAIEAFQAYIDHPDPTGELDDVTRSALAKLHDTV